MSKSQTRPSADASVELIETHLPLVEHIVVRMLSGFPRHVDRSELISAGMMGLVEAVQRFDPERGIPFARFAASRIRGAVLDSVRNADWAPRSVRALARQAEIMEQSLASRLGRPPLLAEVAEAVGVSTDDLERLRARVNQGIITTLDQAYGEDDSTPLVATLIDPGAPDPSHVVQEAERMAYLRDAVTALPERHRAVIQGYFLESKTSEEIAQELGITQSRVSQLRADALEMMRDGLEAQDQARTTDRPVGRVARRKSRYANALARQSDWKARVSFVAPEAAEALSADDRACSTTAAQRLA